MISPFALARKQILNFRMKLLRLLGSMIENQANYRPKTRFLLP
jgi:hypothetical protein